MGLIVQSTSCHLIVLLISLLSMDQASQLHMNCIICGLNTGLVSVLNFSGLGVVDFEAWRPVWRQNWASLLPYRDVSRKIEKQRQPVWWTPEQIEAEVTRSLL